MEASNNPSDYQIHDSPNSTTDLPETQRPSQERKSSINSQSSVNNNTTLIQQQNRTNTTNSTNATTTTNSTQQNEQQQRQRVIICNCGLESVLREVKANTINKGRYFWSCSKFGGSDHLRRCNFFRWDSSSLYHDDGNEIIAESSSIAQNRSNRPEMPYVLIESANFNIENNGNDNDDGEIDLSPCPDQLSDNEETRASTITTPPATPHRRARHSFGRAFSPQAPESPPTRQDTTTTIATIEGDDDTRATRNLTGDVYTRNPAVFGNWDNVPKFSTPQLLDIVQNHLVQQDNNYQKWYTATQSAKKELDKAKREVESLKRELDGASKESKLSKRENDVLKAEKRLLQHEVDSLKEENRDLKRRRY